MRRLHADLNLQDALTRFPQDQFETLIYNAVIGNGPALWRGIGEGSRSIGKAIGLGIPVQSRVMVFRATANGYVRIAFPPLHIVCFSLITDGGIHFNVIGPGVVTPRR